VFKKATVVYVLLSLLMYACDSSKFKDKLFVCANIQQEPNISKLQGGWGENTLSGIHLHIPTPHSSWTNICQNLVATVRKGESYLLEVADSELCTVALKSDTTIRAILWVKFRVDIMSVMIVHDRRVINV
jgi:hypothetical protein